MSPSAIRSEWARRPFLTHTGVGSALLALGACSAIKRECNMAYRHCLLVAAFLLVGVTPHALCAQAKPDFSQYDYQVTDDNAFGLYIPKGWTVGTQKYPNGRMVVTTNPKDLSYVSMLFLETIDPKHDSVTFAGATLKNVTQQIPDLKILEARSSADRMRTVVKYQKSGPQNVVIEGRYSFNIKHPTAVVFGYEAPAKHFKERVPTLLTVISNITILDPQTYQRLASQRKADRSMTPPMKHTSAPDGTCTLLVPEGWNLTAGMGRALCATPDGDTGFIFSLFDFVGKSQIPYFDNSKMPGLHYNYMLPADALVVASKHTGSTNHRILERYPNPSLTTPKGTAEIALVSYTSKNGVPCVGYFDVVGGYPSSTGQWGIIVMGFWAPQDQFSRFLPSLIQIMESFQLNQQWAADQVRQGRQRVQELMKKTSSMMSRYAEEMRQSSLASHQNRMKSGDFISYKFSTYMRGEQEWVTGLEGGKLYTTDHHGLSSGGQMLIEGPGFNYYNYQGEKYGHIPVDSSREVYERVKGVN
jgi:hypothetical protein